MSLLTPFRWATYFLCRFLIWTRYRVRRVGMAEATRGPGPFLVLPNHPAYIDPPIALMSIWPRLQPRPMLLETNFQGSFMGPFARLLRAIQVPDLDRASADARDRAAESIEEAVKALKAGENVIVWPSGRIMRDGVERLGGARAVADILAAVPDATVVLVRTRGLWGSFYSWAQTGKKPNLPKQQLKSVGILAANLLVFMPRRAVTLTFEAFPREKRPEPTRAAVNRWLEEWYNADVTPEAPTYVRYHFLAPKKPFDWPPPPTLAEIDPTQVKPSTKQAVAELLAEKLNRPLAAGELRPEAQPIDLGLDSLDWMDVTLEVERRFGFTGDILPTTVGQLWALAEGMADKGPPKPAPADWFTPPTGPLQTEVSGTTIPEAIIDRLFRTPDDVFSADDIGGVLRYKQIVMRALMLAEQFRELEGASVGLLLPASSAGLVCLFALHFAGKLPVILNWTTGPGNMAHGVRLTSVKKVVTSRLFVDRARVEVPGAEFVYLEDVAGSVGRFGLARRWLAFTLFRRLVTNRALARLNPDPDRPCVVLFTSGSEKAPKAVPLTHANILSDLRGAAPVLGIDRTYSVLVFLPLFHSFGHTVTGLFTFLIGVKVCYHPDPTDAAGLVRKAAAYKTTALAATPTFFGYMLDRAKPGDLDALKLAVLGAEKVPPTMFGRAREVAPNAVVTEGYGITECSPVVSVNPPTAVRDGTVGVPVVGLDVCVTDLETGEVLPAGRMGMLHVSGPSVFPGYLGHDGESPFKEFDGKKWYVTGDLAEVADGYIRLHGRLKRFIKAGGEMISLPALEEPLARAYPATDDGPRVAVEGVELAAGRRVVLFTTADVSLREANALLSEAGFRGVMRVDEVRKVDKIPVLGTGKTDYKVLRGQIEPG